MMQQKLEDKRKRKKVIALKATSETEDEEDNGSREGESDNELVLLIRKFKKFLKWRGPPKEKPFFKKNQLRGKEKEENKEVPKICYKCKKLGHFRSECSFTRKESKKKKAYVTTWDDYDSSFEEEKLKKWQTSALWLLRKKNKR